MCPYGTNTLIRLRCISNLSLTLVQFYIGSFLSTKLTHGSRLVICFTEPWLRLHSRPGNTRTELMVPTQLLALEVLDELDDLCFLHLRRDIDDVTIWVIDTE